MGIKIGINGFGRIGRVVMRILADDPERFDVCGINLRKADIDYMVYLLKYDSHEDCIQIIKCCNQTMVLFFSDQDDSESK